MAKPDPNAIYWAEIQSTYNGTQKLALNTAPLHVGDLLEKYLWFEKSSVILTSATLTTWNTFDYLRNRLNAREANELMLGSPFDYENSALLYLVNDIPEPSVATQFQNAVDNTLIQLARATGGRMLVLFTSYAQLKNTSARLSPALSRDEIYVYEQGEGASASALLDTFKETEKAVLLGTRSFWEGVDVPGESLSVVVIVKLPFDVPSDPIISARSETYENPFNEYNIPEAVSALPPGVWTADPQPIRPRDGGRARPAPADQILQELVPGIVAGLQKDGRPDGGPARRSQTMAEFVNPHWFL